jgi:hypothetical protein
MSFSTQRAPEVVLSEESRRPMTEQILRSQRPPLSMTCLRKSSNGLIVRNGDASLTLAGNGVPTLTVQAGDKATFRFIEYFTANIRNPNTRQAYYHAVFQFFAWCETHGLALEAINPIVIAAYIEGLMRIHSDATVKQHLAAIHTCCNFLITGHILPMNLAASVKFFAP